jgi:GT2 family glycosyltransferase
MSNIVFEVPKPRIFHFIPWNSNKNIGKSYNDSMSLLNSNDWGCFIDGDAVHTTTYFGSRIEEVIKNNPSYSLFTCYTNRIGCPYQIAPGCNWNNNDMTYHRNFGETFWNKFGTQVMDITKNGEMSGVLILIKKSIWEQVGGFKEEKMLSVDNDIHRKVKNIGGKVGLMKGIYLQHWYRGGNINDKKHLL